MKRETFRCEVCGQREHSIFCGLAGKHLERLDREKAVHRYERGQTVFQEGTPALAVYHIYSGRVKLYKSSPKGDPLVIRLMGPGEITGYRALLAGEPFAATAEALEATTVCVISKQTLLALLQESCDLALRLMAKLAKELRTSEEKMVEMAHLSVKQRAAHLLLFLQESYGEKTGPAGKGGGPPGIPLQHKEMAEMIGTTPETFSRVLHGLARKGIIRLTKNEILIQNPAILKTLVPSLTP
ncbi:MAG: Crp/Fnr family transcriptional regulator [candidate division Zixibacteria bacterium]|nr:Crp/Fnr family transcriptional regulator [candidate division Zixibacteria bacterium]